MRIRKQSKQALSLILSTLIATFAFALLLVTIIDLNADNTLQLESDAHIGEASQVPPYDDAQENTQEPPNENSAAPTLDLKIFDFKISFIIIVCAVFLMVVVCGAVLLSNNHSRNHSYCRDEDDALAADEIEESRKWESNISDCISHANIESEMPISQEPPCTDKENSKVSYQEGRGYYYSSNAIESDSLSDGGDMPTTANEDEKPEPETSSSAASIVEDEKSEYDFVDIPQLFAIRPEF